MRRVCRPIVRARRQTAQIRIAGDIFLPTGACMAHPDVSKSSSGDKILREIAQKERELQEELVRAQQEAARLVEEAQRQADALRARAREQVQQEVAAAAAAAAADAQAISEQVLARARTDAEAIRAQAEGRMNAAVDLVVREVLGGLT